MGEVREAGRDGRRCRRRRNAVREASGPLAGAGEPGRERLLARGEVGEEITQRAEGGREPGSRLGSPLGGDARELRRQLPATGGGTTLPLCLDVGQPGPQAREPALEVPRRVRECGPRLGGSGPRRLEGRRGFVARGALEPMADLLHQNVDAPPLDPSHGIRVEHEPCRTAVRDRRRGAGGDHESDCSPLPTNEVAGGVARGSGP